jgi:ferric-dicitrate binding protein FerR (iron transport regulator)
MQDDDIEQVLISAGAREKPPVEIEREVREGLRTEWRGIVAEKRRHARRRTGFALAAGVLAAAVGVWIAAPRPTDPAEALGTLTIATGDVHMTGGMLDRWKPIAAGRRLTAGQSLETGSAGRGAIALSGGVSARMDHDTRLALASAGEIVLERGALYIDAGSGSAAAATRLDVVTPTGSVRHVGTQYEVRLFGSDVRLRVREGRVEWQSKTGSVERSQAGEQLTIADDGTVDRRTTPIYGESWNWIVAAAPGIEIEGLALTDFLSWAGRELGRDVRFDRAQTADEAAGIVLHGSIAGLTPQEALDAVLATTHLRAVVADGRILLLDR